MAPDSMLLVGITLCVAIFVFILRYAYGVMQNRKREARNNRLRALSNSSRASYNQCPNCGDIVPFGMHKCASCGYLVNLITAQLMTPQIISEKPKKKLG